jgi:hypothetical protein
MTPQEIRSVAQPILYRNPFWSDPVDAANDPVMSAAAVDIVTWEPIRRQRVRTAIWVYVALWMVEVVLVLGFFSQTTDEAGERWGWPTGIHLLMLFLVWPGVLAAWTTRPSTIVRNAVSSIRAGSAQRYQQWLAALQQRDPVAHGQVVLWHQGNQANQLATAQLATQIYTAYQVTQTRRDLRDQR